MTKRCLAFCAVLILTTLGNPQQVFAEGLGIGVKPIPQFEVNDRAGLSNNSRLWFVVEPGSSSNRKVLLLGSSVPQRVNLRVVTALEADGELSPTNEDSPLSPLISFSMNNFILGANENKIVEISLSVPLQTQSQSANAFLTVTVGGNSRGKVNNQEAPISAVVNNQIRTALRMFIGIGSYEDFFTDFEITDFKDYSFQGKKFVDVFIKNTGRTPITPQGDVAFSSLDFSGLRFGPFPYLTMSIEPGEVGRFKLRVTDELTSGNWQVLIKAKQGDLLRTKIFERNLRFKEGIDWINLMLRVLSILGALLLLRSLRRNFSLSRRNDEDKSAENAHLGTAKRLLRDLLKRGKLKSNEQFSEIELTPSFKFEFPDETPSAKKSLSKRTAAKRPGSKRTVVKSSR